MSAALRVATRRSALARAQSATVGRGLAELTGRRLELVDEDPERLRTHAVHAGEAPAGAQAAHQRLHRRGVEVGAGLEDGRHGP